MLLQKCRLKKKHSFKDQRRSKEHYNFLFRVGSINEGPLVGMQRLHEFEIFQLNKELFFQTNFKYLNFELLLILTKTSRRESIIVKRRKEKKKYLIKKYKTYFYYFIKYLIFFFISLINYITIVVLKNLNNKQFFYALLG